MRAPIKLNRSFWPRVLGAALPSAADPRILEMRDIDASAFTDAVSTFKFGRTFKTTEKSRFPQSLAALTSLEFERRPVILDVGASDGVTSLDVMRTIAFERYYVTDANMTVFSSARGTTRYFYAADGACILISSPAWILYPDTEGAPPPFASVAGGCFARAPALGSDAAAITLVNPALKARMDPRVRIEQYDILEGWPHEKADLIIAANILNRVYFSAAQLMTAVKNLAAALNEGARLAIIDNREVERATIFRLSGERLSVERRLNDGTEIEAIVLEHGHPAPRSEVRPNP